MPWAARYRDEGEAVRSNQLHLRREGRVRVAAYGYGKPPPAYFSVLTSSWDVLELSPLRGALLLWFFPSCRSWWIRFVAFKLMAFVLPFVIVETQG